MSTDPTAPPETPTEAAETGTIAARFALKQRAGGVIVPVLTGVIAFLIGGLVVLATGHNPLLAYRDIFNGAGLNWIFHPTTDIASTSAYNLSQTLLQTTTLILTGLAVAFAFRCGMFNIGGQGQYLVGLYVANWLGYSLAGMQPLPHILIAVAGATLAGAASAGIAGFLKATVGAHEVISTIMLNWIAIWVGIWLFGDGGPLQNSANSSVPISNDVAPSAQLPVFWGVQGLQGLDVAFFVALAALVVFALLLNRTTLGYEVRAVGFNPEAAAYGGISVKKNLIRAMAISGAFERSTCSAISTTSAHPTSPSARWASWASQLRCWGGTPPSGSASVHCSSAHSSSARRTACRRTSSTPRWPGTSRT